MFQRLLPLALLLAPLPALADPPLKRQVEAVLASAPAGTRFGLLVVDEEGREVVAIDPDRRFIPASNTKLFTTAAAWASIPGMDQPDAAGGTQVALTGRGKATDVVLFGRGDARMSSAPDCAIDCLAALADAVAAKTRRVRDVVGDDSVWPDQRWSPGMSWNNIGTDSGTAVSALNLDDNELRLTVTPGAEGQPPTVAIAPYFTVRNEARTVAAGGKSELKLERAVNAMELRLYGTIPADAQPWGERIGIDDPAHYAAWSLKTMLEARGVRIAGKVRVVHRAVQDRDYPTDSSAPAPAIPAPLALDPLASLTPPPLAEDVVRINKVSQNLHAQALFRRVGGLAGTGSEQWARKAIEGVLDQAGIPRAGYDFSDGSGMSTYNRVSPRAAVALLRWASAQPWGAAWLASLPVGGVDGTLGRRFKGTVLEGRIRAKTGTLNATNALSGTMLTQSGREFTFSIFANDVPDGASALAAMDHTLVLVAQVN